MDADMKAVSDTTTELSGAATDDVDIKESVDDGDGSNDAIDNGNDGDDDGDSDDDDDSDADDEKVVDVLPSFKKYKSPNKTGTSKTVNDDNISGK